MAYGNMAGLPCCAGLLQWSYVYVHLNVWQGRRKIIAQELPHYYHGHTISL